jgi:AraC family transcriptional regulator of adaptative response/methylated-DNA-[protein]-cysteine methyltransferase
MRVDYTITDCPLGRLLVATTDQGICSVCLGDSDEALETTLSNEYPAAQINRNEKNLLRFVSAFQSYFGGRPLDGKLPLDVRATAFQWKVWNEIQSIPYGKTATYGEIARDLGVPQGARAVANACAKNPVSLLVPCHRVVRGDGSLGGYRWGKKRKQALLSLEQAVNRRADLD